MNMKKLAVFAIAVLLAVPAYASASRFTASKVNEQIVEGHTVFTVLQKKNVEQGWDIVGKVREIQRGPNVLWFNDQWKTFFENVRQPCGGYVLATWAGVDPTSLLSQAVVGINGVTQPLGITYVESYHITDPNGAVWDTDLYAVTGVYGRVIPIWITTVLNSGVPDDGVSNCAGILDLVPHKDPGSNGVPYHDNVDSVPIREYNFDLFGLWKDVLPELLGGKEHGEGGADNTDGTGCESFTEWQCDAPDSSAADDFEGNSHPYNPNEVDAGPQHSHETSRLDVFFFSDFGPFNTGLLNALGGYPPNPRTYAVFDTEVVESEVKPCDPSDPFNNILNGFHDHCP